MPIPPQFVEFIEQGRCTLFLGAGASASAGAPSGSRLGKVLAETYLGDPEWELGLESTASMICARLGGRPDVEREIERALAGLEPSEAHRKIPRFHWRAIVTTNYDQLVEKAYKKEPCAAQPLNVLTEDRDLAARVMPDTLPLIKPHGCISRLHEISVTSEDIYEAKQKRRLLFERIAMLHVLGPVVYVGYSLHDRHILDMIYDLTKRLGNYRSPILFVTQQAIATRADMERRWFENVLQGEYLADGFDKLMAQDLKPAIVPSLIIPQMAPCEALTFGTGAHSFVKEDGVWACWLDYAIGATGGFAGVIFERRGDPLDFATFNKVVFELNVPVTVPAILPATPRKEEYVEALKLEGMNRVFLNLHDISQLKDQGWKEVSFSLGRPSRDLPRRLQRVVLADNGSRAALGQEYRLGIRNVKFI